MASPSQRHWRLIPPFSAPGSLHMAVDRWLFEQCAQHNHPPTFRFYTWSTPTLSLGRNQRHWPPAWQTLAWHSQPVPLVHRPTGGRAVLHQGDLTYMVVTHAQSSQRKQAYRSLCQFLIAGWQTLGFNLAFGDAGSGYFQQPNCFALATAADLVLDNSTKLIGSAQAWHGNTVLQHGSIRLHPPTALWSQVFGVSDMSQTFPNLPDMATVIAALTAAAQQQFQVNFMIQPLAQVEWTAIRQVEQRETIESNARNS